MTKKQTDEFKNKCAKYFWSNCMVGDKIDWDSVDGSNDFSVIPRLKNGCIKDFEVGEFRTIIDDIVEATATRTRQEDIETINKLAPLASIGFNGETHYLISRAEAINSLTK